MGEERACLVLRGDRSVSRVGSAHGGIVEPSPAGSVVPRTVPGGSHRCASSCVPRQRSRTQKTRSRGGPTRILVAVATRHGATQGIADSIGEVLREHGLDCTVARVEAISSVSEYDAIVLGSGIYAGHWLKSAREFAEAHAGELAARPTWLFSSGPIESAESVGSLESGPVKDARLLAERIGARGEQTFAGRSSSTSSAAASAWSRGSCARPRATSATGRRSAPGPVRSRRI